MFHYGLLSSTFPGLAPPGRWLISVLYYRACGQSASFFSLFTEN